MIDWWIPNSEDIESSNLFHSIWHDSRAVSAANTGYWGSSYPNQPQPLRKTVTKPDSQWHEPVYYALCASGGGSRAPCTPVCWQIIFEMEKWQSALSPVFFVVVSSGSYTEIQVGSIYLPQKIGCSSQDDIKTLRPWPIPWASTVVWMSWTWSPNWMPSVLFQEVPFFFASQPGKSWGNGTPGIWNWKILSWFWRELG